MLSLPQILILFQSLAFTPVHYSSLFTLQAIGGPMIRKAEVCCQGVPLEGDAFPIGVQSSVAQSCPTLCDSMDCSPQGSSVHGILQAVILGCLSPLQEIFPTQESNPWLLHVLPWQAVSWLLSHLGSPAGNSVLFPLICSRPQGGGNPWDDRLTHRRSCPAVEVVTVSLRGDGRCIHNSGWEV